MQYATRSDKGWKINIGLDEEEGFQGATSFVAEGSQQAKLNARLHPMRAYLPTPPVDGRLNTRVDVAASAVEGRARAAVPPNAEVRPPCLLLPVFFRWEGMSMRIFLPQVCMGNYHNDSFTDVCPFFHSWSACESLPASAESKPSKLNLMHVSTFMRSTIRWVCLDCVNHLNVSCCSVRREYVQHLYDKFCLSCFE